MIAELLPVVGGLGGFAARLAPEFLRFFDRKNERGHELAMLKATFDLDKLKGEQQLAIAQAEAAQARESGDTNLLLAAIQAQARPSGVAWIDGVSALIRPFITVYWCAVLYSLALWFQFQVLVDKGDTPAAAFLALWGTDEKSICAGIIAFWFADRQLIKRPAVA